MLANYGMDLQGADILPALLPSCPSEPSMMIKLLALVAAAAAASDLDVACSHETFALNIFDLFFAGDQALCDQTCGACGRVCNKADADGTLFWCGMSRGMKRTLNAVSLEDAPESIALACDAVSGARVRFMLSANATNDDVTDDEEFCYGGCTKCGALTCVRTEGGPSPTGLGHCEPRA